MEKVLYLLSDLRRCGPTNQLKYIVGGLNRENFEPILVTLSREGQYSDYSSLEDYFKIKICLNLNSFSSFLSGKKLVEQIIKEEKVKIVQSSGLRVDFINAHVSLDVTKITTLRNYIFEEFYPIYGPLGSRLLGNFYYSNIKRINVKIACSRTIAERVGKLGVSCEIIRNGIDLSRFPRRQLGDKNAARNKLGLSNDRLLFLYLGRITEIKNLPYLITTFERCAFDKPASLLIVGRGEEENRCRRMVRDKDKVLFCGETEDVLSYLYASDFLVSASKTEGLPNAVLEALSSGIPVCLSNIGQHREIIENSDAGVLFELDNLNSATSTIESITRRDYDSICKASRELAEKEFDAKNVSIKYQQVYARIR